MPRPKHPTGVCAVEGCGRQPAAKGYCKRHYDLQFIQSHVVSGAVSPLIKDTLVGLAKDCGMSLSALVAEAVREYVERMT